MQKKLKMKSWQLITLVVLFIITVVLIIAVNALPNHKNQAIAAEQSSDMTPSPSVALIGFNEDDATPEPSAVVSPSPSPDNLDTTEHTNGVTVTTDDSGNQTIDRDWGGSDDSTKPSATPEAEAIPSPSANVEKTPAPSAATTASTSPSQSSSGGSSSNSSTPKNGATKTEGGIDYIYVEGFGWIVNEHGESTNIQGTGPGASGEYVGSMG